jgi:2-amino-4-hydroxy-6-hydroxymethyldihydropteridine diphosphokinase
MTTDAPASRPRRVRVYLGLGANVGDAAGTLARAVGALAMVHGVRVRDVSPLYSTRPWGVTDQPDFRNAVVAVDTTLAPLELLAALKTLERDAGRRRRPRWGPRELDLDLLVYGRQRVRLERPPEARSIDAESDPAKAARLLEVPHRHLGERLFVLAPLADLAPRLVPPGWRETVETRRRAVAAAEPPGAVRRVGGWDQGAGRWVAVSPGAGSGSPRGRIPR